MLNPQNRLDFDHGCSPQRGGRGSKFRAAPAVRRRLDPGNASAVRALYDFGHLIGNTDMHFGDLSLWADDPAKAQFELAPLYDMLPMRWRTDGFNGLQDYTPFEPPRRPAARDDGATSARTVGLDFWRRASTHAALSPALRGVATEMAHRLSSRA